MTHSFLLLIKVVLIVIQQPSTNKFELCPLRFQGQTFLLSWHLKADTQ